MGFSFNADEIFEMAEQVERNGSKFYRMAAEKTEKTDVRQMLIGFAAMEDKHEKLFATMRKELSDKEREETVFDPDGEAVLYLRAMADKRVFDLSADLSEKLTGKETEEDIIKMALVSEKESILFYVGMMKMVPKNFGRSKINDIIGEEMKHITLLSKKLMSILPT